MGAKIARCFRYKFRGLLVVFWNIMPVGKGISITQGEGIPGERQERIEREKSVS